MPLIAQVLPAGPKKFRPLLARLFCTWALLVGTTLSHLALAGDLQVSPISLEFSPTEQAQGVWLSNTGTSTLRAQVRVQQWTQADGAEQLTATQELAASPPIVEIAPGQQQLVRIIRLQPTASTRELSYRLLVDELPDEIQQRQSTGLQLLLRYSVPVFVLPQGTPPIPLGKAAPATDVSVLTANLDSSAHGTSVSIVNQGTKRVRISQLVYVNADGSRVEIVPGLLGYVLAGQRMQWPVLLPESARPGGQLKAKFNNDAEEQSLPLVPALR